MNMDMPFEDHADYGKAIRFDGVDDFVELPENLTAGLNQFTFEARYFYGSTDASQRIFDFGAGGSKFMLLTPTQAGADKPTFWIAPTGFTNYKTLQSPEALQIGQWHHFAVVLDGTKGKLYINGELKDEKDISFTPADLGNLNNNWLGKSQFSQDPYLTGKLDEVRIWSAARSQDQIQANKDHELTGNETDLLVYYDFNTPAIAPTYSWSFPGGTPSTSSEVNPKVKYAALGTYDVSLSITAGNNNYSGTKSSYINVDDCLAGLSVDFTVDKTDPCVDESVQFTSLATGSDPNHLYDHSGKGNNGTLNAFQGQPYIERTGFGKSLDFDGEGNYVSLGDLGDVENWTIETWFKRKDLRDFENLLHSKDLGSNRGIRLEISNDNQALNLPRLQVSVSGTNEFTPHVIIAHGAEFTTDWYHLAIVGDKSNNKIRIYLNGEEVANETHTDWVTNMPNFVLGRGFRTDENRNFNGSLDEFRIWNFAKTQQQVRDQKDRELNENEKANLIAYYKFNQQVVDATYTYNWRVQKNGSTVFTSEEANPSFTFADVGTYSVSLTITSNSQPISELKEGSITVEECRNPLTVDFIADNTEPCIGETVQFINIVSGGDGDANQAYDLSGNGNHGELQEFGSTPYEDHAGFGKALNFEGAGNIVSIGDLGEVEDWTIETWFKPNRVNSNENLFHSEYLGRNNGVRVEITSSGTVYPVIAGTFGGQVFST